MVVLGAFLVSAFSMGALTMSVSATTASTDSSNATMPTIHFSTGTQTTDTLAGMIADFNTNFSDSYGFKVQLDSAAFETTSQHDTYLADFQAHSTDLDVISMDVIWPAEFASAGYIVPLDNVFNTSYQSQFLQAPIQAGTVDGHIYGVPWFHDSAMLFYRSDILQYANAHSIIDDPSGAPPATWAQLNDWTVAMMGDSGLKSQFNITSGFVWQGKSYEGLMCDFMEYIGGTGTYTFLNADQSSAVFNTSSGISSALQYMKGLIDNGASPKSVLTYDEEGSRAVWNAGNAIFMRNWPYAYALSLASPQLNGTDAGTGVQTFNVTTMPAQNATVANPRTSCLGGWQLGVSAYSKYQTQAKEFVMWLTDAKQQTTYFLGGGETPTLKALYDSPAIMNSKQGYVHNYLSVFEAALPRPVSALYPQMSAEIAPTINNYLGGGISLSAALDKLQADTNTIINANAPKSSGYSSPIALMIIVFGLGTIVTIRKRKNI
jgi:multiple sugar transport system substrate-binding protein